MTMSSADFLDEWFEFEPLKATMSASGIIGTFMGIKSPGSAYVMLHHYLGDIDGVFRAWGFQRGGTGAVSMAIARSAEHFGAEIMTEAPVSQIVVKNGRAVGVALENGHEYEANVVVSGLDPKLTFLNLVESNNLPTDFVRSIENFMIQGSSGKVNLALDGLPNFTCLPGKGPHLNGAISISPDFDYIEKLMMMQNTGTSPAGLISILFCLPSSILIWRRRVNMLCPVLCSTLLTTLMVAGMTRSEKPSEML